MYNLIQLLIIGSALSYNPTLDTVALNRQTRPVSYHIERDMDLAKYSCLLGVPHGYEEFIGREAYFIEFGTFNPIGPYLIVDVEAPEHKGIMDSRDLLADINCSEMVHKHGIMVIINDAP